MYVREELDITSANIYWSGAVDTINRIREADKLDEFESFIESYFSDDPEPPTMTQLNDLLWFESDWIYEQLGITDEDDEEDEEEEEVTE